MVGNQRRQLSVPRQQPPVSQQQTVSPQHRSQLRFVQNFINIWEESHFYMRRPCRRHLVKKLKVLVCHRTELLVKQQMTRHFYTVGPVPFTITLLKGYLRFEGHRNAIRVGAKPLLWPRIIRVLINRIRKVQLSSIMPHYISVLTTTSLHCLQDAPLRIVSALDLLYKRQSHNHHHNQEAGGLRKNAGLQNQ